jgi:hypothetical protein
MAFCTNCGANVAGSFCNNCGTPVAAAGAAPAASAPPPAPTAPIAAAPVQRKTSPIVWVLVIVLGLFVLAGIGTVAAGYFVVHKVRQAGFDPDLMRRNPGLAVSKMIATFAPDAEVLSTDDGAGTITIRDRKTGKVVTMSFDDARKGKFSFHAEGPNNEKASIEVGGNDTKVPADVPVYPGATVEGNFTVNGNGANGEGTASQYQFKTSDAASKVLSFYHDKLESSGMKMALDTHTADGGMLMAEDDASGRAITVIVGKSGDETSISLTTRSKK